MNEHPQRLSQASQTATQPINPRISSRALFQSGPIVEIDHEGVIYRLQITRQGKLILTK